ncbi:MAG: hypothetical protein IPH86_18385 [bacterium]|nr:hypothetical protein [bacterium]
MSGGVDSAVALAMLQALGCRVECVTFRNFCYAGDEDAVTEQSCCSLEAIEQARRLASLHGAPHWGRPRGAFPGAGDLAVHRRIRRGPYAQSVPGLQLRRAFPGTGTAGATPGL